MMEDITDKDRVIDRIILWSIVLVAFFFTIGVLVKTAPSKEEIQLRKQQGIYNKEHSLLKISASVDEISETSSWYFILVAGGGKSATQHATKIRFCWQFNNGSYVFSEVPIKQIRVNFIDTSTPTVLFHNNLVELPGSDPRHLNANIDYAVFNIAEKDWPKTWF